ncbi:MAG: DUF4145 domain-containing protein, partial [Chitinophagaceae bacterium]|nr:DUF4145 domain-containing protein [Chitinophagaceae bacterium]
DVSKRPCPHCGVFAEQVWTINVHGRYIKTQTIGPDRAFDVALKDYQVALCSHCKMASIWLKERMVYPLSGTVEMANPDMPEDIMNDYNEAKDIVNISPRGAAALLRLAVQKLCKHLGEKGENINDDIKSLVKKGLQPKVQQALDSVRVIGNNAVHPGTLDLNDSPEIAYALFGFINIICETMISQTQKIDVFFETYIPENAKKGIEKRDGK